MNLRDIKRKCPDTFSYRGKDYRMTFYGKTATHKGQRSDCICWSSYDNKNHINYNKGYIYAENDKGEIFAEVEE